MARRLIYFIMSLTHTIFINIDATTKLIMILFHLYFFLYYIRYIFMHKYMYLMFNTNLNNNN